MNFYDSPHENPTSTSGRRRLPNFSPRSSRIPSPTSNRTSWLGNVDVDPPQNSFMMTHQHVRELDFESSSSPNPQFADDNLSDSDSWVHDEYRIMGLGGKKIEKTSSSLSTIQPKAADISPETRQEDSWRPTRIELLRDRKQGYMEDFQGYNPQREGELHNPQVDDDGDDDDDDDDDDVIMRNSLKRRTLRRRCGFLSIRGVLNLGALLLLTLGLVTIFAVLPIVTYFRAHAVSNQLIINSGGYNMGGINGSGQVPILNNLRGLIDPTTPGDAMTRQGFDGQTYNLVFSDEFSEDGRTFWPGDDPYWEAVNLHYWATGDLEWYDPDAITTAGGKLQITITKEDIHDLNYRSGMLQSWNKFCFTGGYIEVSVSLPGSPTISGFWPGAWTMGNLARAGYGATTDGTWPYSYQACDIGTLKNQTTPDGTGPTAAVQTKAGGPLSYLPGQKLSSCTCPNEDHPGPTVQVGRGSPEIDIIEAQVTIPKGGTGIGQASQSAQFAPFDDNYEWVVAGGHIVDPTVSKVNTYKGGVFQESVSVVTTLDQTAYFGNGGNFQKFGFEYIPGDSGSITWSASDTATWTLSPTAIGENKATQISARTISQEPMYIILNLAISAAFETVDLANLVTPNQMLVDYVRVYQRKGQENTGCSPSQYPTENYINQHLAAYTNPNFTTWGQAGYNFPKNSLQDTC